MEVCKQNRRGVDFRNPLHFVKLSRLTVAALSQWRLSSGLLAHASMDADVWSKLALLFTESISEIVHEAAKEQTASAYARRS